ncbi:MAG: signal peptidase I [bacterium]
MKERRRRELIEWVKTIVSSAVVFLVLRATVVEAYYVPTGSMRPTILENDRILGSKFYYRFWEPKTGDVVVFRTPERVREMEGPNGGSRLVKRVVAKSGDLVQVSKGVVRVNGKALSEPYVLDPPDYEMPPVRVPAGCVFVLGDNRNDSLDGHVWGFLPEKALLARAFLRYWPPQRIGTL